MAPPRFVKRKTNSTEIVQVDKFMAPVRRYKIIRTKEFYSTPAFPPLTDLRICAKDKTLYEIVLVMYVEMQTVFV